jgi:DNA-binding transcriptional ArsR family regulator
LRILRALAENPRGLADLAEQFEMPKTTMHHHMVTLRSAGLVSVGAGTKDYRIRRDALPDLVQLLSGYIGTDTDGEGRASASASRRPPRRRRPGG